MGSKASSANKPQCSQVVNLKLKALTPNAFVKTAQNDQRCKMRACRRDWSPILMDSYLAGQPFGDWCFLFREVNFGANLRRRRGFDSTTVNLRRERVPNAIRYPFPGFSRALKFCCRAYLVPVRVYNDNNHLCPNNTAVIKNRCKAYD